MRQVADRKLWLGHAGDPRDPRTVLSLGGINPPWLLRLASESVAALIRAGVPTLVCCACGHSRTLCIAAAGFALAEEWLLEESLSGPADVSPGLLMQLRNALGR